MRRTIGKPISRYVIVGLTGFYDDDVSPWIDSRNGSAGKRINWKSAVDGDSDLILRRRWAAASPPILKSTDRVTVVASSASTSIQVLSTATGDRIVSATWDDFLYLRIAARDDCLCS